MNTPHKHKDVIIAYANGAQIQYKHRGGWIDLESPIFGFNDEYRVKPEREWPVTSLSNEFLINLHKSSEYDALLNIANAAIKQYIIDSEK